MPNDAAPKKSPSFRNTKRAKDTTQLSTTLQHQVPFFDVDSYRIVWHGHYAKYFEMARCQLLAEIGCTYDDMEREQCFFPVVKMETKYIAPLVFQQHIAIAATLTEWENRLVMRYNITDAHTAERLCLGSTVQIAVRMPEKITQFECPAFFKDRVMAALAAQNNHSEKQAQLCDENTR